MSPPADLMTTLAWSLVHFFWQGAAIAALAGVAMALFREPTTRYVIGVSTLALMLMSFVVTFAYLRGAPAGGTEAAADASLIRADDAARSSAFAPPSLDQPAAAGPDLVWVARGWLGVVCLLALRVACGLLLLEYLRRRNLSALPVEVVDRCLALQRRLGISRVVRYCACHMVAVPSVVGFLRPIVLLPMRALTGLSAEQLEAVIAHELGHIKRFDVAVNFLQVVVETLFFFHPAVWWLNKRIRVDREDCCDDVAISACGGKVDYARALAIMADWRRTPQLSMAATGGDVAGRVARLLGMSRQNATTRSVGVFTAVVVLAAALTAGAASIGVARPALTPSLAALQQIVAQADTLTVTQIHEPIVAQADAQLVAQADSPRAQSRSERRARDEAAQTPDSAPRGSSFIDEMRSAGFDVTDVDQLIALKIHNVTGDYVRQIRDAGLDPDTDEVIAMKIHDVTPDHIAQVRAQGFELGVDEVMAMTIHDVTPEYIAQVRDAGFDPDFDEVIAMKIHGVTPEYIARLGAMGFELESEDVIALRIHNVTPDFINEARARFPDLSLDQIIRLKNANVL